MPYLVASDLPAENPGLRFRALVERGSILQIPGAHNGMAALQAKAADFEALYLSGAAMTASMGVPDLGINVPLLAMTEFGRTPFFTASEFEAMGYRMVIWPVSSPRAANKAQEKLYATIRRDGSVDHDGKTIGPYESREFGSRRRR